MNKEVFKGYLSKEKFSDKLITETGNNDSALHTLKVLQDKYKTIFDKEPRELQRVSIFDGIELFDIVNSKNMV